MNPALLIKVASVGHPSGNHHVLDPMLMLAHQGGWDEALLVGLPLALIGLLLWVANRRVSAQLAAAASNDGIADDRSGGKASEGGESSPDADPDNR